MDIRGSIRDLVGSVKAKSDLKKMTDKARRADWKQLEKKTEPIVRDAQRNFEAGKGNANALTMAGQKFTRDTTEARKKHFKEGIMARVKRAVTERKSYE